MNDKINNTSRRILIVGFGNVGQSLAPLLLTHFDWASPHSIQIITADMRGIEEAGALGLPFAVAPLTKDNYAAILRHHLSAGDLLINVSVDVSSLDLIEWCQDNQVLYIDTCIEPWAGGYTDAAVPAALRTNYALREAALALAKPGKPTAVVAHGANPGLVSHFLKKALHDLACQRGVDATLHPAEVARQLGIKAVHIAERDTQRSAVPRAKGAFHNTWSPDGLMSEARQCAELGWGTHEGWLPERARLHFGGCQAGIYLDQPGASTRVRSWVPSVGEQSCYLITHHEALSIADYLTVRDSWGAPVYRPTVFYAYRPSDATCASLDEWSRRGFAPPAAKISIRDCITSGHDELGVLLLFEGGAYWYGSTLTHAEAARLSRYNNATTLQVTAAMVGAIKWMVAHPCEGVVEAEAIDHEFVLAHAMPYLGAVRGVLSDWEPAGGSDSSFAHFLEEDHETFKDGAACAHRHDDAPVRV